MECLPGSLQGLTLPQIPVEGGKRGRGVEDEGLGRYKFRLFWEWGVAWMEQTTNQGVRVVQGLGAHGMDDADFKPRVQIAWRWGSWHGRLQTKDLGCSWGGHGIAGAGINLTAMPDA